MTAQGRHRRIPIDRNSCEGTKQAKGFGVHLRQLLSLSPELVEVSRRSRSLQTPHRLVATLRIDWPDAEHGQRPHLGFFAVTSSEGGAAAPGLGSAPAPPLCAAVASGQARSANDAGRASVTWRRALRFKPHGSAAEKLWRSANEMMVCTALAGITWKGISSFTASTLISIRTSCGALSHRQTSAKATKTGGRFEGLHS